ncbi:MAG: gfo/Idh/MocA family oxidoreductase [Planctomycetaceae bacterium]|nr:MAG: gfo/Idh/MocA family oxidoreductase [Planctomycetaceae bacterium]
MNLPRREFLKAASVAPYCSVTAATEPPRSANNIVRVGVIGTGVRGKYLIGNLPKSARVTAICDCVKSRMAGTLEPKGIFVPVLQSFRDHSAARCATHQDYRQMLDREKLDAVIIATPDHHHAPAAMLALQAGLDVYLEKPLTVSIREGRLLANIVKQTDRVLQVGSQQRTMEINRFACESIRDGGLGKVTKVELPNYPGPLTIGDMPSEPIPEGLDWNLFLGPTPWRAHSRKLWLKDEFKVDDLLWRGWDLYRDFSGHMMTNWGGHTVDMVQYALGKDDTGPVEIRAIPLDTSDESGRLWKHKTPLPRDARERRFWPVVMRYADGVEVHFVHGPDYIRFHGERGILKMRRNHFETDPPDLVKNGPDPSVSERWNGVGHVARPHLQNWLDCIRTRGVPQAPVEVGHRTATICHLANIARELSRPLRWDPATERFPDDPAANELLVRPRRQWSAGGD